MAKTKPGKKDVDSYNIKGTTKVVRRISISPSLLFYFFLCFDFFFWDAIPRVDLFLYVELSNASLMFMTRVLLCGKCHLFLGLGNVFGVDYNLKFVLTLNCNC